MKRLGFFLSVFSVGLVVFLIATGQFTKIFQGSDAPVVETPPKEHFEMPKRNRVVYHNTDLEKGRKRFTLTGDIEESIALSREAMRGAKKFHNAVIDVPIDGLGHDGEAGNLKLEASEVLFLPGEKLVRIEQDFVGTGTDGTRFETSNVELHFKESKQLSLGGPNPVSFNYTRMRLHGEGGFEALIDDSKVGSLAAPGGLEKMTVKPPVVVAVDRDFMGFAELDNTTSDSTTGGERIFIVSETAPLTIDRHTGEALFDGRVRVFRAALAPDAPLFPAPSSTGTHLTCHRLRLTFATDTMQLTSAQAERGEDWPITAQLATDYTLVGDRLSWDDGSSMARLVGDVNIVGPIGSFEAREARLFPHRRHLTLDGDVKARLNKDPWRMTADRVEVEYDPQADRATLGPRAQIRRLVATGTGPKGIEIREDRDGGAVLVGAAITYQHDTDALQVTGDPAWPNMRPTFQEGINKLAADRIELSLSSRRLQFIGGVDSRIESVQRREDGQLEPWFPSGTAGEYVDVRCEDLTLEWDSEKNLHRVVIRRGDKKQPVRLRSVADVERTFDVHGDQIVWLREFIDETTEIPPSRFVIHGSPARLSTQDASLAAREIQFDSKSYVATARGNVHLGVAQALLEGGDPKPGRVTIECQQLDARFRSSTKNGERVLLTARASSGGSELITITNGAFQAAGQELTWNAEEQLLRLEGERDSRQKLMRLGPHGGDELTAKRITVHGTELRVDFEGEVRGVLYQADPDGKSEANVVPWTIEAGAAHVLLALAPTVDATPDASKKGTDNKHRPMLIQEALLSGGVSLRNEKLEMHFRGSSCQWRNPDQRLRIFSEDGMQWQTLTRGTDSRDQISAREVSVVRIPSVRGVPQHLNVLFEDVTEAVFHHRNGKEGKNSARSVPGTFRLSQADRLMLIFAQTVERQQALVEALAWGGIHLRGGEYQVIAQRAIYRQADETLVFHGERDRPVRVDGPQHTQRGQTITLKRVGSGYTIEKRGRYPWRSSEIQRFLDQHRRGKDE